MRLIDADELEVMSYDAQGHRGEYAQGYDDGVSYMAAKIDRAPTIDAIPVEWIVNMQKEWLKSSASFETCGAISAMLHRWWTEQEVR